ncbi:biosynthetic peptidoglycan transglycosylase, partial [Acinetobacter baumannii]
GAHGALTIYIGHVDTADASDIPRKPVPLSQVSKNMVNAIMAAEDHYFYKHHGIDAIGILRATIDNLKKWRFVEGASTITQQLAK